MTNMIAQCKDFLTISPNNSPYNRVEYILCDPSCSGSGIVSRMDELIKFAKEKNLYQPAQSNDKNRKNLATKPTEVTEHEISFPEIEDVVII